MATGLSKTKWTGPLPADIDQINETAPCFVPVRQCGDAANRLYFGDNLAVMRQLLNDVRIAGKVRLIYIDPPYATNSVFQTRKQQDAYTDLMTGADYINFMRERLELMRRLLSDDGSIYVHLDNKMVCNIKVVMDEIFGIGNFRAMITRRKCKCKNYTRNTFGNVSDYILFYTKTPNVVWNRQYDKWDNEKILKEYPFIEEGTGRRYKRVPVHAPGIRNGDTGKPWRGLLPPAGKHWQYTPTRLEEMDKRGEIYWSSTGNPRRKVYLDDSSGIPVQDIWLDYLDVDNQNTQTTGYPTEKNFDMLKRIILASSNEGDLVMDCFAGSGTTLVAADKLKRNWVGVDNSEEAIKVILDRFQNGTTTLDKHIRKPPQPFPTPDLFSLFPTKDNNALPEPSRTMHVVSDYMVFADNKIHCDRQKN
jgi:adenine-specific DNA-methyltransferase